MSKTIGIDLGTTNSCVAVLEGDVPAVIPNKEGMRTTPSVVAFSKDGTRIVGAAARRQEAINTDRTISSIKREMGSRWTKNIDGKNYTPQEISAMILMKLKKDAEAYLGGPVSDAVITVPAYFSDAQRQATKDAGRIAGLSVKRIINEPTAAALAYGLDHGQAQTILVYDLGGGTFDVSIIRMGDGILEVLATAGDNHLGGDDWDARLTDYIVKEFRKEAKVKLEKDPVAMSRVKEEAEKAKIALSTADHYSFNLPFIANVKGQPVNLDIPVTRQLFESLTADLLGRTEQPVRSALADAKLSPQQIDRVLLVGGSTRMPCVVGKVRSLLGKDPSRNINPDECVALGAAVQGGKLGNELSVGSAAASLVLLDVTPLSLSIETVGGISSVLIGRNSTIPTRKSQIFTTAGNFQTAVDVNVYQGERRFVRDNKLLGTFRLDGIRRAPAGVPQIEVTFDIDANGIVKVSAKDMGTGHQQQITITSSSNMTEEEIRRAQADAARYEGEDARRQELLDIRNSAETYVYAVDKEYQARKGSLDKQGAKTLHADIEYLRKIIIKTNPERMTEQEVGEIRNAKYKLEQDVSSILNMTI
ncbi:MAG: molecular chaperone DnaK [Lachnospiraceae bacterium]|jgi:molecular chaperone DnaK|nr:molecular chaperone DnaK [Lachnospiraceae bacterium]MCI1726289.1 molecular chaperone DnaK [Lachnospiraceae bacterium]